MLLEITACGCHCNSAAVSVFTTEPLIDICKPTSAFATPVATVLEVKLLVSNSKIIASVPAIRFPLVSVIAGAAFLESSAGHRFKSIVTVEVSTGARTSSIT